MELKPGLLFSDCWASVGNITFCHRHGKCYVRTKGECDFQGTPEQMKVVGVHQRALNAWRTLPHSEQLQWTEYAGEVRPHRPPFNNVSHISGYNLFVSAYHGFATLGNEKTPSPAPFVPFPLFNIEYLRCDRTGDHGLRLRFALTLNGTTEYPRYRALFKVQTALPGEGTNPGLMRNSLSPSVPSGKKTQVYVDVLQTKGDDSVQIHLRCVLLDTLTGYRSQYRQMSFPASVQNAIPCNKGQG